MTKRLLEFGLTVVLLYTVTASIGSASELRMTPLVRAVQRARPSVVNIHSVKTIAGDEIFGSGKRRKVNGMGTGIVIDERGYIATNYHVIKGVDSLRATLTDGGSYTARVVSFDRKHDLAVIKIDPGRRLAVMPLGTSSDLMLGEKVIAVGNAYGYENTVTAGIVSARSRDVVVNDKVSYKRLIQTDASINPGNSGGPLLNLDGEVVGINVAIRAGAQRIGFAIPIDDARVVLAQLLSIERLNGTYHGLLARERTTGKQRRLVVKASRPDSPASKAGFRPGDVILAAGKVKVADAVDFERALLGHVPGDKIEVVIRRNVGTRKLTLALGRPAKNVVTAKSETVVTPVAVRKPIADKTWRRLGLKLARVPATDRRFHGLMYRGGMRILAVRRGGPADRSGIRIGDVLVGLHVWETIDKDNVDFVLDHPKLASFSPLKFYILRGRETLFGHIAVDTLDR